VPAISIMIGIPAFVSTQAQVNPSAAPAATPALPPVQLQPYTAPDQSASVGVPSGWKVGNAATGMITLSGPQGEVIIVGRVPVAHDGPFQLGQRGPEGADMTMPSSANLSDKVVMVLEQLAALSGGQATFKLVYGAPLQMPPGMGQCGIFAVTGTAATGSGDGMGIFCSFADDSAGFFKNFLMYGSAPAAVA
jgi:hypothetical protein